MSSVLAWAARASLFFVLAVATAGALDPHHNAARFAPPPDVVEHVVYGFLLTLLTIASFPRANPWLIGAGFFALGAGFEALQIVGWVSGTFQFRDLAANVGGVLAALAPFALGRRR
ncbi:MAG: hypothetical protein ACOY5Y_10960 [Pseudomonadota bacterium]|jgi:hypothetical protein